MVNMELDMVADMEVDKVANNNDLIGPKLFRSEAYPNCTSIVSLLNRTFI